MDIMPSQDAIAEFTMLSSNYPPDYGISSGATMSLSLKSGTQKFHGELFEFNRNTDYDADSFFNKLSTPQTPRAATHYNIYGGNIGGPLFIPTLYNTGPAAHLLLLERRVAQDSFERRHQRAEHNRCSRHSSRRSEPDLCGAWIQQGNKLVVPNISTSSQYYINNLLPLGLVPNTPFPNNTIPASLFDPNGVLYLNSGVLPKSNVAGQDKNITNASNPINVRDDVVRVDHKWNDKWQILGHYMHDSVVQGYAQPELGWLWASYNTITSTLNNPSNSAALKLSGTINPNLLVEASINYDGNIINIVNSANGNKPAGWSVNPVAPSFAITRKSLPAWATWDPTEPQKIRVPHRGTTRLKTTSPRWMFHTPWASTP